jgi:hypothetical protein
MAIVVKVTRKLLVMCDIGDTAISPAAVIKSVSDLIGLRTKLGSQRWFRGQQNAMWPLTPRVFRTSSFVDSEKSMIDEFRQSASLRSGIRPNDQWSWCVFAQHYGIPTRLLDWTINPLQALYFAVESTEESDETDARFYALDAEQLNRKSLGSGTSFPLLLNDSNQELSYYLPGTEVSGRSPVAVVAEEGFVRISSQHGVFTVVPKRDYDDSSMEGTCQSWVIPKEYKNTIRKELEFIDINDSTTYPDLEHFAKRIVQNHSDTEEL